MRNDELFGHLQEFSPEEKFYYQYYMAKRDPEQLDAFLASLDAAVLSRHRYVVPELQGSLQLNFTSESWVWEDSAKDIYIHKHPRYMPEWDFTHEFYELVFACYGSFDLHISGHSIPMQPGFVCLIPPDTHHHISIFNNSIALNTKIRKSTFHTAFSPLLTGNDILARFFLNTMYIGDYRDYILFKCSGDEKLTELFSEVYLEHYNQEKYYPKITNSLLSIIFSYLMRHHEESLETARTGQRRMRKIEAILGYIETNFRSVSLKELSKEFYFSEQYLSKYIRDNTGKTFQDIVLSIRLENARRLLETSNLSIGKISEACGYASAEHFTRQFKRQYGRSPTGYRTSPKNIKES